MKKSRTARFIGMLAATVMSAVLMSGVFGITALADSKGTVTVNDAKVRSDASTDAGTLTKVNSGTEVTVTDEKSDSSGNVWYHVTLSDGTTGYIRSDLMTVTASTDSDQSTETAPESAGGSDAAPSGGGNVVNGIDVSAVSIPDGVTAQDYQSAKINVDTGKVRADASTNDDIVAQLARDTDLVIAGSKLGSDSKTWYYVAFLDGGAQKTGYVRSDLVSMGEVIVISAPESPESTGMAEDTSAEAPAEPEVNNDYELVYTDDGTGNNVWYLYNHIDNTREKLQELLDYADAQANKTAEYTSTIQKFKIMSIVLGVLLGICIIALIIMIVKLVSGGYEYEEDDEEEEEEEEGKYETRRPRERERKSKQRRYEEDDEDEDDDDDDDDDEPAPPARRAPAKASSKASSREREAAPAKTATAPAKKTKPKNFMLDDDDFEFEFLNMDDK